MLVRKQRDLGTHDIMKPEILFLFFNDLTMKDEGSLYGLQIPWKQ